MMHPDLPDHKYRFTRLPFGKHKNKLFKEVPDDYLSWLFDQYFVHDPLKSDLRAALIDYHMYPSDWNGDPYDADLPRGDERWD